MSPKKKLLYFEWSPPWHLLVLVSDISSGNIYIWYNLLTFYSGILSDILFWHLFRHPIWHPFWHLYWHFLAFYLAFSAKWPNVFAYVLACYSGMLLWHSILLHIFWHSFRHSISGISSEILCGWGPAGIALIHSQSLLLGSGGEHCDLELAVEVRRGSLWSRGCCSGPAGNTAI